MTAERKGAGVWGDGVLAAFAVILLLLGVHFSLQYFSAALLSGALASALLALVLLTAAGCGRVVLRGFRVGGLSESEKTLIGATLGVALLSQAVFLLGALGWLKAWAVSGILAAAWVVGFTEIRDALRSLAGNASLLRDRPALAGGTIAVLALLFWLCWVPPHHYDSLVYHLPLAASYVREARIFPVEHLLYTHFPQNAEMLYTLALLLGSDLLAQMFTWLGTFLSVWWLLEMGKRQLSVTAVLLACLLTVTNTAVMLLTPTAYVECLVMLWVTATVLSVLRWRMESDEKSAPRGWLLLAGVFAGIGVGTKYYAGVCPGLIGLYLLGRWIRAVFKGGKKSFARERLLDVAVFGGAALAAGLPWLIKNAVVVGNPVFPFFYDKLPLRGVEWGSVSAQRYFSMFTEYGHQKGHFLKDLIEFPYLAASGSTRFGGGADVLGELGWGLLFAAAPLAVWAAWRRRYLTWLLLYCAAHWAVWFNTGVVMRFLAVLVPLLALLAAQGLHQAWERASRPWRFVLVSGAGLMTLTNLVLFLHVNTLFGSFSVLSGVRTRDEYLSRKLDYYPCAAYARENLGQNDKILVAGEVRGYHVVQPHEATQTYAPNRFVRIANRAADAAGLARELREEGFRYVLFVPREAERLNEGYGVFHFNEKGRRNWNGLGERHTRPVFRSPGRCHLYGIASE